MDVSQGHAHIRNLTLWHEKVYGILLCNSAQFLFLLIFFLSHVLLKYYCTLAFESWLQRSLELSFSRWHLNEKKIFKQNYFHITYKLRQLAVTNISFWKGDYLSEIVCVVLNIVNGNTFHFVPERLSNISCNILNYLKGAFCHIQPSF